MNQSDFRIDQEGDTRFVYLMPFSKNRALVEYTVFSESKLVDSEYDKNLAHYCESMLRIDKDEFDIIDLEFGFPHQIIM